MFARESDARRDNTYLAYPFQFGSPCFDRMRSLRILRLGCVSIGEKAAREFAKLASLTELSLDRVILSDVAFCDSERIRKEIEAQEKLFTLIRSMLAKPSGKNLIDALAGVGLEARDFAHDERPVAMALAKALARTPLRRLKIADSVLRHSADVVVLKAFGDPLDVHFAKRKSGDRTHLSLVHNAVFSNVREEFLSTLLRSKRLEVLHWCYFDLFALRPDGLNSDTKMLISSAAASFRVAGSIVGMNGGDCRRHVFERCGRSGAANSVTRDALAKENFELRTKSGRLVLARSK